MKKKLLFLLCCLLMSYLGISQSKISGVVKDSQGIPLIGVNVIEKGTINGVVSDIDGKYAINTKSSNSVLVFSFLSYKTEEVSVANKNTINVILKDDLNALNEVVVVGYGTQKRKDLTGSVVTVKSENFSPGANSNAAELLKGTASGVVVSQTSSAPGSEPVIRIRGAGSVNSSNSVLYVVDGIPGVAPSSLSPGDIESIEVLKDASASSIYGTRASNGVVLITTKLGKKGKSTFEYNTYLGGQDIPNYIDVLGAKDYMDLVNLRRSWVNQTPLYTADQIANAGSGTNWQKEITRQAIVQNHQISMSGGGDNGTFYFGINYFDQDGVVLNSGNKKYNIRSNITATPLERLKVTFGLNYTNDRTASAYTAAADGGLFTTALRADPSRPSGIDPTTGRYYDLGSGVPDNPLAFVNGVSNNNVERRFYGFLKSDLEIFDNLTATLRLAAEDNNSRRDQYTSRVTLGGLGNGGNASVSAGESTHWLVESLLKYENTFGEKHDFSILGGATWEKFDSKGLGASTRGFISDVLGTNALQSGNGDVGDNVSSSRSVNQLNGFLGRMTYGYDDKYLLTASLRVDGSSRFAPSNKYAYFPSASVGWRVSKENFLKNSEWIDELKFRIGYGELGNQGINNFETINTLVPGGNSVFGDAVVQGVVPARLANPDLRWETTAETNVGLDYGFFKNRIKGSVDYFYRKTFDQLMNKPLPAVVGFSSVRTNIGEVVNSGIDFSLNTENLAGDFKWDTALTLSYLKNEVTDLPDFIQQIVGGYAGNNAGAFWIVKEGAPLRAFYGYKVDGLFQVGDDIANSPVPGPGFQPGMPRFRDISGPNGVPDGVITSEDRTVLGSAFPDITFGVRNTFSYKNFSLDVFVNGVQGASTYDSYVAETLYPQNPLVNIQSRYYFDRWTPENTNTEIPSGQNFTIYGGERVINSLTVKDASYVRLKNVTFSYMVPLQKKSLFSSLRVYVSGDNLVTWTDFEGYDPEASILGGNAESKSYNSYPLARTFRLGFDIKF